MRRRNAVMKMVTKNTVFLISPILDAVGVAPPRMWLLSKRVGLFIRLALHSPSIVQTLLTPAYPCPKSWLRVLEEGIRVLMDMEENILIIIIVQNILHIHWSIVKEHVLRILNAIVLLIIQI